MMTLYTLRLLRLVSVVRANLAWGNVRAFCGGLKGRFAKTALAANDERSVTNTVFICQWFPPEPVKIPLSIVQSLKARGHHVTVMTGIPNFPTGKTAEGYSSWRPTHEIIDGTDIFRYPLYPSHDASARGRFMNYVSWALSTALLGWSPVRNADVALVYSSPATAALAPLLLGRLAKTPYVLLVEDLWPDSVMATGFLRSRIASALADKLLGFFVQFSYNCAKSIVVTSPGMRNVLVDRGVAPEKVSIVYNWATSQTTIDSSRRTDMRRRLGFSGREFVVTYAGTIGSAQGLSALIEACSILKSEPNIRILVAGTGIELSTLQRQASDSNCGNVIFLGRLEFGQMPALYAASDVQLVSLVAHPLFAVTMPSKVQTALAVGQPLIVMAPGDAADVIRQSGAGWVVPAGDAWRLAGAIREAANAGLGVLEDMGRAGNEYYEQYMSESVGSASLDRVLRAASS